MVFWIALIMSAALFGVTAAIIAHVRGGDAIGAFVLGFLFGPFGVVWAYFLLADEDSHDARMIETGYRKLCPSRQGGGAAEGGSLPALPARLHGAGLAAGLGGHLQAPLLRIPHDPSDPPLVDRVSV